MLTVSQEQCKALGQSPEQQGSNVITSGKLPLESLEKELPHIQTSIIFSVRMFIILDTNQLLVILFPHSKWDFLEGDEEHFNPHSEDMPTNSSALQQTAKMARLLLSLQPWPLLNDVLAPSSKNRLLVTFSWDDLVMCSGHQSRAEAMTPHLNLYLKKYWVLLSLLDHEGLKS